jgi:peptidylprolyl isomerase
MAKPAAGNCVHVHYTGRLDDGTVFDSSRERDPLVFTIGSGQVIPGFEHAIMSMETGEQREVRIPAVEAYGEAREDMIATLPRSQFPADVTVGHQFQLSHPEGGMLRVIVKDVADDTVTIDANHHLAGKDLIFDLELVRIGE